MDLQRDSAVCIMEGAGVHEINIHNSVAKIILNVFAENDNRKSTHIHIENRMYISVAIIRKF